jgi:putative endonuclease
MEATINEKAMKAIGAYLERRGFEILESGWAHGTDGVDFIAREEDDLVFVVTEVVEDRGGGFPEEKVDRAPLERVAAAYLAQAAGSRRLRGPLRLREHDRHRRQPGVPQAPPQLPERGVADLSPGAPALRGPRRLHRRAVSGPSRSAVGTGLRRPPSGES